jgi:hypothetical protein
MKLKNTSPSHWRGSTSPAASLKSDILNRQGLNGRIFANALKKDLRGKISGSCNIIESQDRKRLAPDAERQRQQRGRIRIQIVFNPILQTDRTRA